MKKYDIIIADPPWPYDSARMAQKENKEKFKDVGVNDEYETMSMEEMLSLMSSCHPMTILSSFHSTQTVEPLHPSHWDQQDSDF